MMKNEKYTRFTFTRLRPTDKSISELRNIPGIILCFYGEEIGPVSRVKHLQGYLELDAAYATEAFSLKERYLKTFYVQPAKYTREANYAYCAKTGLLTVLVSKFKASFVDPLDKLERVVYNIKHPRKSRWGVRGGPGR